MEIILHKLAFGRIRGGGGGGGCDLAPVYKIFLSFSLDDKTSEPVDVYSSYSLIPLAYFETSLVMVIAMVTRCDVISSRWSSQFWVKIHVFSTSYNNKSKFCG